MKTIKVLPTLNNVDIAGRLTADPFVNSAKTRVSFTIVRNFGGDKDPVYLDFTLFLKKGEEMPAFLKKGAPVVVHAYVNRDVYTNKEGEQVSRNQFIVKKVEEAEVKDHVLPSVNNIDFAGRLTADAYVNGKGNCALFTLIRNFGGDKAPVALDFMLIAKKDAALPEFLKKGTPVTVHAYFAPAVYTDKNGNEVRKIQLMVKNVAPAELVERKVKDSVTVEEAEAAAPADGNTEINEE